MTPALDQHRLDLDRPVDQLLRDVCDIESVSGNESALADAVEAALRPYPHLEVLRDGDAVVARTAAADAGRVVVAGHLDTVPLAGNLPTTLAADVLHGRGTVDMKGGVAVALRLAAHLPAPARPVSYVFYDHEEVEAQANGLLRLSRRHAGWLAADFAVLMEPTNGVVEGGCNGTLRAEVVLTGTAAHSARWWRGSNAVHAAAGVLQTLADYRPAEVDVEGLTYREGLNAVRVTGGIAGNVIPDCCVVEVNYRFAPSRSVDEAFAHVQGLFTGLEVVLTDASPGARPGLDRPAVAAFAAAMGGPPAPKYGWTDVALFTELGVPAVNYGPGDPALAHADDERVPLEQVRDCERRMRAWLAP